MPRHWKPFVVIVTIAAVILSAYMLENKSSQIDPNSMEALNILIAKQGINPSIILAKYPLEHKVLLNGTGINKFGNFNRTLIGCDDTAKNPCNHIQMPYITHDMVNDIANQMTDNSHHMKIIILPYWVTQT